MNGWADSFILGSKGVQGLMDKLPGGEQIAVYTITKFEGLLRIVDYTADRERVRKAMAALIPRAMEPAPPAIGPEGDGAGMREEVDGQRRMVSKNGAPAISVPERDYFMRRGAEEVRLSLAALAETLRTTPGRKSVFWITEGFPPRQIRDGPAWDSTFAALNDANIAVNTLDADGLGGPTRFWGAGAILTMRQIAERTGGRAFFHRNDLDGALAEGIAASRTSYTLGFYLGDLDGKYHELKVRVDRPGVTLTHRLGYYARTETMHDLANRKTELESALLSPLDLTRVGIEASVEVRPESAVLTLRLSSASLTFKQTGAGWRGEVQELFVARNDEGKEFGRWKETTAFRFGAAAKPAEAKGVTLRQALPALPGATKLFIAIRDSASGRTGSLTVPLKAK